MLRSLSRSVRRSSVRWHIALALLFSVGLAIELFQLHALATTEHRLTDMSMVRHAPEQHGDPDIVVVDIDDPSLTAMQGMAGLWPWPREIQADLIDGLTEFAPRAIVFDLSFPERDLQRPKSDARFSDAISATPSAYLAATRLDHRLDATGVSLSSLSKAFGVSQNGAQNARAAVLLPNVVQADAWRLGLVNSIEDEDGVLRRYRLYTDVNGWRLPSLPARVVKDLGVSLPAGDDFLMRWPALGYQRFPYSELYKTLTERRPGMNAEALRLLDASLRNKIIVVGASATSSFDHHLTPMGSYHAGANVLAVALDNLKNGDNIRIAPRLVPFVGGVLLICLLAFAFALRINLLKIGAPLLLVSVAALVVSDVGISRNFLLPVATPLIFAWSLFLTGAIGGYLRERRARDQAVSLFGRFLNPNVVRQIIEQGQTVESLSGQTRNVTVLFSDIRGFTTLSESRSPNEIVTLLNRHFQHQAEVVFKHGGTLDKFIGDCIMAFWGAPLDDPNHAINAVAAAMEMQDALIAFKQELASEGSGDADFDIGIGVHSGPAVVGFIGAKRKLDYTAIGDTVNLASRVEGLTKGISRVLVTHDTMLACSSSDAFSFEPHGAFAVKGRAAQVELYEPKRNMK